MSVAKVRLNRLVALAATCCGLTCGGSSPLPPSSSIVGDWSGNVGIAHTDDLQLRFQQNGTSIEGIACRWDDGVLLFSGVPVRVTYPNVLFTVLPQNTEPCCAFYAGKQFFARLMADGTLSGGFIAANG